MSFARSPIQREDGTIAIPLTQGFEATIDLEDVHIVEPYKWYAQDRGYGVYAGRDRRASEPDGARTIYLHRVIMDAPDGLVVDHIDGNSLNNTRANLRLCTHQENSWNQGPGRSNSTGYIGVSARKSGRFRAQIRIHGEIIRLGDFPTAEEAARARDAASIEYYGEFARLNFPTRKAS